MSAYQTFQVSVNFGDGDIRLLNMNNQIAALNKTYTVPNQYQVTYTVSSSVYNTRLALSQKLNVICNLFFNN